MYKGGEGERPERINFLIGLHTPRDNQAEEGATLSCIRGL